MANQGNYPELKEALESFRELFVKKLLPPNTVNGTAPFLKSCRQNPNWTPADAHRVYEILKPYHIQLKQVGCNFESVPKVTIQIPKSAYYYDQSYKLIGYDDNNFVVKFPYNREIIKTLKNIDGARWMQEKKYWNVPLGKADEVRALGDRFGFIVTDKGRSMFRNINENLEASYKADDVELNLPLKLPLYPFQNSGADYCIKNKRVIIGDEMGLGKAQPLYSKLLTPDGWVKMKDAYIGMDIIGRDGFTHKVMGIFPQGKRKVYNVQFSDGFECHCDEDHLWDVITPLMKFRNKKFVTKSLMDINRKLRDKNNNLLNFIPITEPVRFNSRKIIIDPYFLGVLLGDGGIKYRIKLSTKDLSIIEDIKKYLPIGMKIKRDIHSNCDYRLIFKKGHKNPLITQLKKYNLFGLGSHDKFIPDDYKFNTIRTRLSILQGLIDTDGFISKDNSLQFDSVSETLIDDTIEIIQSLGGIAHKNIKKGSFNITFKLPEYFDPCRLKRKLLHYDKISKYKPTRAIKSIEFIGLKETQCIKTTSSDQLYLTDHYIVTHNTVQAIATVLGTDTFPCLVICPKSLRYNWVDEWEKFTNKKTMILDKSKMKYIGRYIELGLKDVGIINYDGARTLFTDRIQEIEITKGERQGKKNIKVHTKGYEKHFKSVVIDEAHECRNQSTLRFKTIKPLCKGKEVILALTGSPIVKGPADLAALLELIGQIDKFGGHYKFIKQYYLANKGSYGGKGLPHNLSDLNIKMRSICFIRREKFQVLKELPDKMRQIIKVDIDNRDEYDHALISLQSWMVEKNIDPEKIEAAMRAEILVQLGVLKKLSARGKLSAFKEFVSEILLQDKKLVVFCWFKETANFLKDNFDNVLLVTGDVSDEDVRDNVKKFQEDDKYKLIVLTYRRGGTGFTLTAASDWACIELGWTYKDQSQAEDREHRIGQKNNVNCRYFLGKDTVDERIYQIIMARMLMERQATGSRTEIQTEETNFKDIIKSLMPKKDEN